jgi:hypothetical protein
VHQKRLHSPEGIARRKIKENAMRLALEKLGVKFDEINRRISHACIESTWAEIDFICQAVDAIEFWECQEHQHVDYGVSCEIKRWTNSYAAHQITGDPRNLAFYLVNPDPYEIDGVKQNRSFDERMQIVVEFKNDPKDRPTKPFSLFFFFYSVRTDPKTGWCWPVIFDDPAFPAELKECCRCIY